MLNFEETSFIIIHELHRLLKYFSDNLQAVLKCLPMTKHPPACQPPTTLVLGQYLILVFSSTTEQLNRWGNILALLLFA